VVFTDGLGLFLPRTAVATVAAIASTTWRAVTTVTAGLVTALGAFMAFAAGLVLATMLVVGPLVGMNGGRMIVSMRRGSGLGLGLFAFAKAKHLFQAGFEAAEERCFFRSVVGASQRGHKR
jgi:hypothetical protein